MGLNFFQGIVRRIAARLYTDDSAMKTPDLNPRGDLCTAQGLPERSELVRLGNSWGMAIPTGSAFTFVNAWPTTRAELVLSNGEAAGGKTYIIDRCWMLSLTSQTLAQNMAMLAQLNPASNGIAAGTDNTAVLRYSLRGDTTTYGGNCRRLIASTAFALTNLWTVLGNSCQVSPASPNLGCAIESNVYGRYLVPPGAQFCLAGLATAATGTAICGIEWHEVQLPMS